MGTFDLQHVNGADEPPDLPLWVGVNKLNVPHLASRCQR